MNPGILMALLAYLIWGLFPLYYRQLQRIPAMELVAHRAGWSLLVLALGIAITRGWYRTKERIASIRVVGFHAVTGMLIAANWLLYVWGVNEGRVVECSLGYFLNPLVSIGLGVVVLRERLRAAQWVAVGLAATGVLVLAVRGGTFPWLSISLAFSFGVYGLLKKRAPLGAVEGLFLETLVLAPLALFWIVWSERTGIGPLSRATGLEWGLLVGTGLVTTVPLLLFGASARRIPLSWVGFIQYLTPTIQFLIGVFVFLEPFGPDRILGFALVWSGLGVVLLDGILPTIWNARPRAPFFRGRRSRWSGRSS